ncbi:MAG: NnrS family protein, partial [Proteobacteria bacterium]|nr:NnrS family protein [Pseudomonadota bacterium]
GLAQLSDAVDGATALHVLSVGAIGSMTLGIMTRAGLGHTGRALKVAPAITFAYLLLSAAAVVRVGGPMWMDEFRQAAMVTAGVGWCVAFTVFTWVYWPILTGPRVDEN